MILGYARVSTEDQHLDAQLAALEAAGAGRGSFAVDGKMIDIPIIQRAEALLHPGERLLWTPTEHPRRRWLVALRPPR